MDWSTQGPSGSKLPAQIWELWNSSPGCRSPCGINRRFHWDWIAIPLLTLSNLASFSPPLCILVPRALPKKFPFQLVSTVESASQWTLSVAWFPYGKGSLHPISCLLPGPCRSIFIAVIIIFGSTYCILILFYSFCNSDETPYTLVFSNIYNSFFVFVKFKVWELRVFVVLNGFFFSF